MAQSSERSYRKRRPHGSTTTMVTMNTCPSWQPARRLMAPRLRSITCTTAQITSTCPKGTWIRSPGLLRSIAVVHPMGGSPVRWLAVALAYAKHRIGTLFNRSKRRVIPCRSILSIGYCFAGQTNQLLFTLHNVGDVNAAFSIRNLELFDRTLPEPSSTLLLLLGVAILIISRYRPSPLIRRQ